MFRGCLNHYIKKNVSSLNKGIGSHLIDSEQNTELVRCNKTSVSSVQRLESDGVNILM